MTLLDSTLAVQRGWLQRYQRRAAHAEGSVDAIYRSMLHNLQHDILLLIIITGGISAIPFFVITYINTWVNQLFSPLVFFIHSLQIILCVGLASWMLRRRYYRATWGMLFSVHITLGLLLIALVREPGIILFTLLLTSGSALVLSFWINVVILVITLLGTELVNQVWHITSPTWSSAAMVYTAIMVGLMSMGVVVRRFIRSTATQNLERQQEAVQRVSLEQEIDHLHRRVRQVAMLKHDLRQPLRVVQGHLLSLEVDHSDRLDLVDPALAALQRAERLLSNLLDQAREAAGQQRQLRKPTDLNKLLQAIEQALPGLARYYTDPPIQIECALAPLPALTVDYEHLERAIFNLLDNALMHANERLHLRAWQAQEQIVIEIEDDGPGITQQIIATLEQTDPALNGFGLMQVKQTLRNHQGELRFLATAAGTRVQAVLPCPKELE